MARFIGFIHGQRGEASRLGSPSSGIHAQARGWNVGAEIRGHVNGEDEDEFAVYVNGGSNGGSPSRFIGTVRLNREGRPVFVVPTVLGEAVV